MVGPIKIQSTNTNVNFDNKKEYSVKKYFQQDANWDVFKVFDKNNNGKIDSKAIERLNTIITDYAGEDKVLDSEEAQELAGKLEVSEKELYKALNVLSSDLVAIELAEALSEKTTDKEKARKLIGNINKQNIAEIWQHYQNTVDDNNAFLGMFIKNRTSLSNDILKNYPVKEARLMLKNIVTSMHASGKAYGIDLTNLVTQYNNALKRCDYKQMDSVVKEMGSRLNTQERIIANNNKYNKTSGIHKPYNETIEEMEALAKKSKAPVTNDLLGDGVLGNTKSVALTKRGGYVLGALEEFMQDKDMKSRLVSCYRKDDNWSGICFPDERMVFSTTPNWFVELKQVNKGSVGDGDTTAFVAAVLRYADLNDVNISSKEDAKELIKRIVTEK